MVSLYRDPEGKNVFSYKDRYTQADQLSKVMSYNADCTGCQHLQTKINMLEVSNSLAREQPLSSMNTIVKDLKD